MELWQQLSEHARQAITAARSLARDQGCDAVAPEHIALGILEQEGCLAWQVLEEMGVDPRELRPGLTGAATQHPNAGVSLQTMDFTSTAHRCLQSAWLEARQQSAQEPNDGQPGITTGHLLLGLISPASNAEVRALRTQGVFYSEVRLVLRRLTAPNASV